jgi:hypothetical protein
VIRPVTDDGTPSIDLDELVIARDELRQTRETLAQVASERDRFRGEVVALKESVLHLTRAIQGLVLPGTIND